MSLPDYKTIGKQSSAPVQSKSQVVHLNIGGHVFSTTLGTIRKFPNSTLAELINGSSKRMDSEGRYFIDRDGTLFTHILEYLRTEKLPCEHLQEVHKEAIYYDIKPLVKAIEETPQFFGETVGRQQFLARVPNYRENLEVIVRVARAEAIASRHSNIIVCVLRTEDDLSRYNDAIDSLDAPRESVVSFGPWKAPASVEDLLDCVKMDIEAKGYKVKIQAHSVDKGFLFKSYDFFYKLVFTWW
ncbi:BTB/POZ domain-containing protein KCTD14 [Danio rerio]|uniref:BTB/POZ domain-containing protein KCTD14 n=1 Tax=Danio rerio TaxID=7955 RepID=A0A2R8RRJ7_DANRE|nr:BTB/POZ domain-containing protein KCTD14 [Danio rerio]|eukprot:XP_693041.2 BTB/POZ domain-containing protein KCTD14 [Danio rerio]